MGHERAAGSVGHGVGKKEVPEYSLPSHLLNWSVVITMGFLPDFRKIYRDSRTDEEERSLATTATSRLVVFASIALIAFYIKDILSKASY